MFYGQEFMFLVFVFGKVDLLIQGGCFDVIKQGNIFVKDFYENQIFDYVFFNLFFGIDWEVEEVLVCEQVKIEGLWFSYGLFGMFDGQMLFLVYCVLKFSFVGENGQGGCVVVVFNQLLLFNSDNGLNLICQWLFEEDFIDVIIVLLISMFYGIGIVIYVWIFDVNKDVECIGKIQLIDGFNQWELFCKFMGDKWCEVSKDYCVKLLEVYKVFEYVDFMILCVMIFVDFMFCDVFVYKQVWFLMCFSEDVVGVFFGCCDFIEEYVVVM